MKKILLIVLFLVGAPLTSFALTCPNGSVFQQAVFVKNDGIHSGWNVFQSAPQAADGWTIGISASDPAIPVTNLTQANAVLKTVVPQYEYNNGEYCVYTSQYGNGLSFWATKTNGPSNSRPQL